MEYDGKKIVQSIAMARFVARENKLAGKNNLEAAQADMLVDCMNDLLISEYCGPKKEHIHVLPATTSTTIVTMTIFIFRIVAVKSAAAVDPWKKSI